MTINVNDAYLKQIADGITNEFNYDFFIAKQSDLLVFLDGVPATVTAITGLNNPSGGDFTIASLPDSGVEVVATRELAIERKTNFTTNGDLTALLLNKEFDYINNLIEQSEVRSQRGVSFSNVTDLTTIDTNSTGPAPNSSPRISDDGTKMTWESLATQQEVDEINRIIEAQVDGVVTGGSYDAPNLTLTRSLDLPDVVIDLKPDATANRLKPATLAIALDDETLLLNDALELKEHTATFGGGGKWDVVALGTFPVDSEIFDVFDHNTLPFQLKLRIGQSGFPADVDTLGAISGGFDNTLIMQFTIDNYHSIIFGSNKDYLVRGDLDFNLKNQTINFNGSTLRTKSEGVNSQYMSLNINADNVVFDLNGGAIDQGMPWGEVSADVAPEQSVIPIVDTSLFNVGDVIVSSWGGNEPVGFPLSGPSRPPQDNRTITSLTSNSITLSDPMAADAPGLPEKLVIGDFRFIQLINAKNKGFICKNGALKNVLGYYHHNPGNETVTDDCTILFDNIEFQANGLDQFFTSGGQRFELNDCTIAPPFDMAKTGIVQCNSVVRLHNTTGGLGAVDASIIISEIRGPHTDSELIITDCSFSGASRVDKNTTVEGDFAVDVNNIIVLESSGVMKKISIKSTFFTEYTQTFIGTTVLPVEIDLTINEISVDGCTVDASPYFGIIDGASSSLNIPTFKISDTLFFQIDDFALANITPINGASVNVVPSLSECTFRVRMSAENFTFGTDARVRDCDFFKVGAAEQVFSFRNSRFQMESSFFKDIMISVTPNFSASFVGFLGTVLIDNPDFPSDLPNSFDLFNGGTTADGHLFLKAKSVRGGQTYDIVKSGINPKALTKVYKNGEKFSLAGDDIFLSTGCQVHDTVTGELSGVFYARRMETTSSTLTGVTVVNVDSVSFPGNRPQDGDKIHIALNDGQVHTATITGYIDGNLDIPFDVAMPSDSDSGSVAQVIRYE